jgi:uncharacterized protein
MDSTKAIMQPIVLIDKYYRNNSEARSILLAHSKQVADFALAVAQTVAAQEDIDCEFVEEAALLHDIGMIFTNTPSLKCFGDQPYLMHGIIGAELLKEEGLPRHALACERHIGVGLTVEDIIAQELPLPPRDMTPQSTEEKILAYADLFFSKTRPGKRTADAVRASLARYGQHKVDIFNTWHQRFGE